MRLGGYVLFPRMLDKGRATLAGTNGEYNYACPLDQRLLEFLGLDPDALKQQLATGKGDHEILLWVQQNAKNKRTSAEIAQWSAGQEARTPEGESKAFFEDLKKQAAPHREDITTWFDLLDVDDFGSYGGKP